MWLRTTLFELQTYTSTYANFNRNYDLAGYYDKSYRQNLPYFRYFAE